MTGSCKTRRWYFASAAPIAVFACLIATACAIADEEDGSLLRAQREGLRVGFAIEAPFAFVDSAGHARGEGPVVLRHVAHETGIDSVQWFPLEFTSLIPALEDGRIDVVASGLFVTEQRARTVRFSHPKACLAPALVMRASDARGAHPNDCDTCTIAVIHGSIEQLALQNAVAARTAEAEQDERVREQVAGEATANLLVAPDLATAVAALKSGQAGAFAISEPTARVLVERDETLMLQESLPDALRSAGGCAAFAFRTSDESLAAAFDSVLRQFIGSEAHRAALNEFGFTPAEIGCAVEAAAGERLADC
ncbi:MAG: transporter substrate-binding domain-containing protein [Longimicrobiales bacterium]